MTTIRDIRNLISSRFPEKAAETWDNPGLQLGRNDREVKSVLISLELTEAVAEEAITTGADLILTHHPFIFKALKSVTDDSSEGRILLSLAEHRIGLLASHTNLDSAPDAIAQKLADDLKLSNRRAVLEHQPFDAYKIVVFVPVKDADKVAQAMHSKGAGCIGEYSDTSFRVQGEGRFTCGMSSNPAIGEPGSTECVDEMRLEMVVSGRNLSAVTRALLDAHPYEEPAFDVFKLESEVHGLTDLYGFGMAGELPEPMRLDAFVAHLKDLWDIPSIRVAGSAEKMIRKVGIMNGAGAKFMMSCRGLDAYITGDCGHHDFDNANRHGIALIDAGHYDTEKFIPQILANLLKNSAIASSLDVKIAKSMCNPMKVW